MEKNARFVKLTETLVHCPARRSHFYFKDLKLKIGDIGCAQLHLQQSFIDGDKQTNTDNLDAMLPQDNMEPIRKFLVENRARESKLGELFSFDDFHVAETSMNRLFSLGDQMRSKENAGKFTSRVINQGVELELSTLQSVAREIQEDSHNKRLLTDLKKGHRKSIQKVIVKQKMEMLELLLNCSNESQNVLETRMTPRLKLVKSIRNTKEEFSILTKFLSSGPTKIVEQLYKDALQDQDQQHACEKANLEQKHSREKDIQEQKLKTANEEVALLSATVKEAKFNHECCVCYNGLEGFSLPRGRGESSSVEKLHKRACFLPCMHANVCTKCSEKIWNRRPSLCPTCCQKLTEKPRAIYS